MSQWEYHRLLVELTLGPMAPMIFWRLAVARGPWIPGVACSRGKGQSAVELRGVSQWKMALAPGPDSSQQGWPVRAPVPILV